MPGSGCNAFSISSNANVEALLSPPGVVGRLRKDVPDTADADRECRVVVRDISSASSPLSYRSVRKNWVFPVRKARNSLDSAPVLLALIASCLIQISN